MWLNLIKQFIFRSHLQRLIQLVITFKRDSIQLINYIHICAIMTALIINDISTIAINFEILDLTFQESFFIYFILALALKDLKSWCLGSLRLFLFLL